MFKDFMVGLITAVAVGAVSELVERKLYSDSTGTDEQDEQREEEGEAIKIETETEETETK